MLLIEVFERRRVAALGQRYGFRLAHLGLWLLFHQALHTAPSGTEGQLASRAGPWVFLFWLSTWQLSFLPHAATKIAPDEVKAHLAGNFEARLLEARSGGGALVRIATCPVLFERHGLSP